jgi:hypothetical protein
MRRDILAAAIAAAAWALTGGAGAAVASPGDLLFVTPSVAAGGVSVAFDGHLLYYTNPGEFLIHRMTTAGVEVLPPIPTNVQLQVLTYDATRDMFWGVDEPTQRIVYLVDKTGFGVPRFTIAGMDTNPDGCDNGMPTGPGSPGPCGPVITGIAYDSHPDSIWIAPDSTQRMYHFDTVGARLLPTDTLNTGTMLGWYDTNEPGQAMEDQCGTNNASGIAVANHGLDSNGGPVAITYDTALECRTWFRYRGDDDNTPIKQASFSTWTGTAQADAECDDLTFKSPALWIRDSSDGRFFAFDAPYCTLGGGTKLLDKSRMTGGGGLPVLSPAKYLGTAAHHGFMLHCDPTVQPDRLEVTWGNGNSFNLTSLNDIKCTKGGVTTLNGATFDKISGSGSGRVNGQNCGSVTFTFQDNGEPGSTDTGDITVTGCDGSTMHAGGMLLTGPLLGEGNYQTHQGAS